MRTNQRPDIFVSATSGDLGHIRELAKEALLSIDCHPVEQTNFPPDYRSVEEMLRAKIADCEAVLHIVGIRYGAEPDPATLPPGFERQSYTQMEARLARELGKKLYLFLCPEDFAYGDFPEESEERQALQQAYRQSVRADKQLRTTISNESDVQLRVRELQTHIEGLRQTVDTIVSTVERGQEHLVSHAIEGKAISRRILISLGVLTLVTSAGFAWMMKMRPETPAPVSHKGHISIVAVMGENVPYEKAILEGFRKEFVGQAEARGYSVSIKVEDPRFGSGVKYASPDEIKAGRTWHALMRKISESNKDIDYFVTLGTYATKAVMQSGLLDSPDTKGLIYLGITDPKASGFEHIPKLAGVQYGPGPVAYGKALDRIFKPGQRLAFLYNEGVEQDEAVRIGLEKCSRELGADRFEYVSKPHDIPIEIEDIPKPDLQNPPASSIYFAWYGLDNILSTPENYGIIKEMGLWVIPSTYSPKNLEHAGVVVSVEDASVGKLGAELLVRKLDHPSEAIDQYPIAAPPFVTWIHRSAIRLNGMAATIKPEILSNSSPLIDDKTIVLID